MNNREAIALNLASKCLNEKQYKSLTYEKIKDGIECDYATTELLAFVQAAKAQDAELIAELVEALSHYTNVVESVYDPNDWGPKVRDAGSFAREALAKVKERV